MDMVLGLITQFFTSCPTGIMHIAGENGTRKSRLLQRWIASFGAAHSSLQFYLLDTEGKLDVRGYQQMEGDLPDRIFVQPCHAVGEFARLFHQLQRDHAPKMVVVDSFSNLLKGELCATDTYSEQVNMVAGVAEQVLPACARLGNLQAGLVLVHHMTCAVKQQRVVPYYFDLCQQVRGAWMFLYHDSADRKSCAGSLVIPSAIPPFRMDFTDCLF